MFFFYSSEFVFTLVYALLVSLYAAEFQNIAWDE